MTVKFKTTCPRCGEEKLHKISLAAKALSRRFGNQYVCSDCGLEEAYEDLGWIRHKVWAIEPVEQS